MRLAVGIVLLLVAQARGVGQTPATSQQPTFKTVTTIIEVDAIVKDRSGKFVPDLTTADFEVAEDGVLQRIEQLYVVAGPDVKTAVPVPNPTAPSAVPASPAPSAPTTQRTFVFLFDPNSTQAAAFVRARDAAVQFLAGTFRDGDIGGVVSNGTMINNRLTTARAELEAAVKGLQPSSETRSVQLTMREWPRLLDVYEVYLIADRDDREAIARAVSRACNDDPGACGHGTPVDQIVTEKARNLLPDFRVRAQQTMRSVRALVSGLRKLPGRKTIILLSDGFFVEDEWANLRQITDEANRASVRIYALDTRGLNRGSASSDIIDMGPHGAVNPGGDLPLGGFDTVSDGPNSLAVDTGGLAIRNENDFAKAFREIASDSSSYYVLGYRTTNTKLDGKFRQITVKVRRSGLSVRARKGYLATPDLAAAPPAPVEQPAGEPPGTPPTSLPGVSSAAPPSAAPPNAPAAPAAPPSSPGAAPSNAAAPAPIRLQPDVNDRLAELRKDTPEAGRSSQPGSAALAKAREGWDAYQRGDLRAARTSLQIAAADPKAPPWVRYVFGWSEYAYSGYTVAAEQWERVRATVPEFEPVYFDLADAYLQQHEFGKALEVLRVAEKRWPKDVEVYNAIGVVQVGRGTFNDAIKTFEQAVAVDPNDATACYNLARTHELRYIQTQRLSAVSGTAAALQDKDPAIEYYRRTIALGKQFVEEAQQGLKRLGVQ